MVSLKASQAQKAVFFDDSRKPQCPKCLYGLNELDITDYGVEESMLFYISPCKKCSGSTKYYTDKDDKVIKVEIVERRIWKEVE